MRLKFIFPIFLLLASSAAFVHADSAPFGIASAYNLVALSGNISDSADITGRIAAAGQVTQSTTIGSDLRTSDPDLALASANGGPYAIVAQSGITATNYFNINAGGNVYASFSNAAGFNFVNENYAGSPYSGSSLLTGPTSPINFASLQTQIDALTSQLEAWLPTGSAGQVGVLCSVSNSGLIVPGGGCPTSTTHYNPSSQILYGTSATDDVFNISAAQFASSNYLDIVVPTGATVIINVTGCPAGACTLNSTPYINGVQETAADAANILFNFPDASILNIDGELDGAVLAPYAFLSGGSDLGGNIIAASIGQTGEVHYDPFDGTLPGSPTPPAPTPEPATLFLLGTGLLSIAGILNRRSRQQP